MYPQVESSPILPFTLRVVAMSKFFSHFGPRGPCMSIYNGENVTSGFLPLQDSIYTYIQILLSRLSLAFLGTTTTNDPYSYWITSIFEHCRWEYFEINDIGYHMDINIILECIVWDTYFKFILHRLIHIPSGKLT